MVQRADVKQQAADALSEPPTAGTHKSPPGKEVLVMKVKLKAFLKTNTSTKLNRKKKTRRISKQSRKNSSFFALSLCISRQSREVGT